MNSKLLSILAIVAISIGLYGLLQSDEPESSSQAETSAPSPKVTYKVITLKAPLDRGDAITRSKLIIETWPESKANQMGIDSDMILPESGGSPLLARDSLAAGDILYPDKIVSPESPDYLDYVTRADRIPFPIKVSPTAVVGGAVRTGTLVDIMALASTDQNLANETTVRSFRGVSLSPVLIGVKVLKVEQQQQEATRTEPASTETTLILELTRKQVATMTIAKRIAQLEVHKSFGKTSGQDMSANAGDVLEDYRAIKEFRADSAVIK
ncbi:Flp pilus assembly protein CpaB [Salinivibrio sp. ML290]|uniref:Flp pilus assembly protein CpaB n=1 Tax=Salinivibrio sp. ML290 TaxID=1909468 RepID=UPI0009883F51|nr:Flp pilus assembly protein CpaB [Salinivibrio sp. ML290]OOE75232.1 Flp pilus assembly protein CpaB [Salinivibrio sp. ML290]